MTVSYILLGVAGFIALVALLPRRSAPAMTAGPGRRCALAACGSTGIRRKRNVRKRRCAKRKRRPGKRLKAPTAALPAGRKADRQKVLAICRLVKEALKRLKLRLRVRTVECLLVYGGGDAAKTAVTYGELNAAVYALLGFAGSYLDIQNVNVDIRPDFENARLLVCGRIEIQGRVGNILLAFLRVFSISLYCKGHDK